MVFFDPLEARQFQKIFDVVWSEPVLLQIFRCHVESAGYGHGNSPEVVWEIENDPCGGMAMGMEFFKDFLDIPEVCHQIGKNDDVETFVQAEIMGVTTNKMKTGVFLPGLANHVF